jgi:hypothetical protein
MADAQQAEPYRYLILVDDNFADQDEQRRYKHSEHRDPVTALAVARGIVDACRDEMRKPEMSGQALYDAYRSFGEDPFIQTNDPAFARFSAWDYARQRCGLIPAIEPEPPAS